MKFIVEVPAYLQVEIDAPDAETAARIGNRAAGAPQVRNQLRDVLVELVLLDEDAEPDVYVCRGGLLSFVDENGAFVATLDSC